MTVAIANVRTIFLKFIFYFCHYSVRLCKEKTKFYSKKTREGEKCLL